MKINYASVCQAGATWALASVSPGIYGGQTAPTTALRGQGFMGHTAEALGRSVGLAKRDPA